MTSGTELSQLLAFVSAYPPITHSLSLSSAKCPDMAKILLKKTQNPKSSIHPSIYLHVYDFPITSIGLLSDKTFRS